MKFFAASNVVLICLWINVTTPLQAQNSITLNILDMKERAEVIDRWTEHRLDTLVPELMLREEIDMWVLTAREYNEDPVLLTMLPATWQSSRRTTILVFFDPGDGEPVQRMAIARYNIGFFETRWDVESEPDQWKAFAQLVSDLNPDKIVINTSDHFALADGISYTGHKNLVESLDEDFQSRIISAENLAIGWLETRTEEEMIVYRQINRIAHHILADGLSEKVITPGITTTKDVEWWYRDRIRELGFTAWFHPSVSIDRKESEEQDGDFSGRVKSDVIQPGDLLHVDFGITYLRLNTDTQRNAYVLKTGETNAPDGLRNALKTANRLQDILTDEFKTGRSGNEILASALEKAHDEEIDATIYTHPIGYHGHAAGPTIGLWDQQDGVPGNGDYPLYPNTAHSIELNARVHIPEWNRSILMKLEEDAFFDGNSVEYIDGRAENLYLIPRQK